MTKLVARSGVPSMPERRAIGGNEAEADRPPAMHVHFANDDVVVGWWGCVLISIWRRDQWPEYARLRGEAGELLARQHSGPLLLLTLVLERAGLPDEPTRQALARLRVMPSHQRVVACAGIAEGPPLRVAGARAVSISLDQIVPPPFPTRMFGDRVDAVLWLRDALGKAGGAPFRGPELLAALAREAPTSPNSRM